MIYKLRDKNASIPGGYFYYQAGPKPHKFASVPFPEHQVSALSSYRKANNLERSSPEECYVDIIHFHGVRLGGNPRFFIKVDDEQAAAVFAPPSGGGCKGCGAAVNHN